jgi:hypothetical protein
MSWVSCRQAAQRLKTSEGIFLAWAKRVGVRCVKRGAWSWSAIQHMGRRHGLPERVHDLIRYDCKVCGRGRVGPFVPEACSACIWREMFRAPEDRTDIPKCEVCGGTTAHRKPWCLEHIEESPYVKWLLGRIHTS